MELTAVSCVAHLVPGLLLGARPCIGEIYGASPMGRMVLKVSGDADSGQFGGQWSGTIMALDSINYACNLYLRLHL